MSDPWKIPTESVLGSELKTGDIVRSQGYRWEIDRVIYDSMQNGNSFHGMIKDHKKFGRWYVYAHALNAPDLPSGYRNKMELALREDLEWCREFNSFS